MISKINWREGFKRVWLTGTIAWAAYNAHTVDFEYIYTYYAHREILETEEVAKDACEQSERYGEIISSSLGGENPYDINLKASLKKSSDKFYECITAASKHNKINAFKSYREVQLDLEKICSEESQQRTQSLEKEIKSEKEASRTTNINTCIKEYKAREPSWDWLVLIILVPTVGVALAVSLLWGAYRLFRWLIDGFKPNS